MTVQTSYGSPVQFTEAEMQIFKDSHKAWYRENAHDLNELFKRATALGEEKAALVEKKVALDDKKAALGEEKAALVKEKAALVEKKAALDETMKELNIRDAKANQTLENVAKKKQELVTKQFYSIFHGKKPLPTEEIDALFNTYLAEGALSFGKSSEGVSYTKLSSMNGVVKYLNDHLDIKNCDFRVFKTDIHDIPTLAKFLKNSTVKAIALNSGIPQETKESLAEAVAARNGGLKVQYFA